jgi:hypothetical protein
MSNLILDWLENLNLSRVVHSLGESFQDGYLLGEIMYKYNQQRDFEQFVSEGSTLNILRNFELLDSSLRLIGVRFTSKIAGEVMKANVSVIKTLLYELKVSLERITRNSRQSTNPLLWGTRNDKVFSVIGTTRTAFDASRAQTVQRSIQGVLENPNTVMMNAVVKRFRLQEEEYNLTKKSGECFDLDTKTLHQQRAKDIYKSRKEHENDFKEAWDSLNLDQWKKNQKIAHDRKVLRHTIDENIQKQKDKRIATLKGEVKSFALHSMGAFDKKLETLIISEDCVDANFNGRSMIRTLSPSSK